LRGTRLDEVSKLEVSGVTFVPETLSRDNQHDELKLVTHDSAGVAKLKAGDAAAAHVALKDGRTLDLSTAIAGPRPQLNLLSKNVQVDSDNAPAVIQLGNSNELPQDGRLSFFLKTQVPETFPPAEKVEVATGDESFHVLLSEKDGNLTLQDSKTVFATLDPMKLLGPSAFGPLKFRPVSADGVEGDWQPLASLVRMPDLKEVRCTPLVTKGEKISHSEKRAAAEESPDKAKSAKTTEEKSLVSAKAAEPGAADNNTSAEKHATSEAQSVTDQASVAPQDCVLSGDKLFLIDAVSADPDFAASVTVPDGFVQSALNVPVPKGRTLYIKLRDDPSTVDTAVLPVTAQP
jgi:hypothetical protein